MNKVKTGIEVRSTKDYFLFKAHGGNRQINQAHKNRLKKSMEESYLFSPIIVNQDNEIIDGHHRFECIKELGLPLYYFVVNNYGLSEMQRLNANLKKWNLQDHLDSYCDMGNKHYIELRRFMEYSRFTLSQALKVVGNRNTKLFRFGDFKPEMKSFERAYEVSDAISAIEPFYKGARRNSFIAAISTLVKKKEFIIDKFINKLKVQPGVLVDYSKTSDYINAIELIYNYRNRNKVNLRI